MFSQVVWLGLFVGVVGVACNDRGDRVPEDGRRGEAGAGAPSAGTSSGGGSGNAGGDSGTDTGGNSGTDTGGNSGTNTGGNSGAGTGGGGSSGQAGTGGNAGAQGKCNLDPEVYEDDSPSTSSTVSCGRLGDLSAGAGFALDVGHATSIKAISKTAARLLSYDERGAWVLWDLEARTIVERGRSLPSPFIEFVAPPLPRAPVLSDTHLATLTTDDAVAFDLDIRSALDGNLVATVTMPGLSASSPFGFASDGSYLWARTNAGVRAWSMNGEQLVQVSGNYEDAGISAAPGELRIGSASRDVIERIATATGNSTLSPPFQGTFHSWFVDGARFLTTISNAVRVYSASTVTQENLFTLPTLRNLTGQGEHVWIFDDYELDIYALSDPSARAARFAYQRVEHPPFPAGNLIGVVEEGIPSVAVVELGPTLKQSRASVQGYYNQVFAADAAGNWALGGRDGELFESTDLAHPLSCGKVLSMARADDGTTAVSTAAGGILLFRLTADSRQYLGTIPRPSGRVELSRDGLVLAASANLGHWSYQFDRSLRVYSLPDRSEIKTWPGSFNDINFFFGFSMSAQGNRFARLFYENDNPDNQMLVVGDLDGNKTLELFKELPAFEPWSENPPRLSFTGARVAVWIGPYWFEVGAKGASKIYENGALLNTLPGRPLAWFDDDRLLVSLDGAFRVYDSSGNLQPTPYVKAADKGNVVNVVSATEIYSQNFGAIYSLTSGDELWDCGSTQVGSAAAGYAVFVSSYVPHKVVYDAY
jgi:hypothetical protein